MFTFNASWPPPPSSPHSPTSAASIHTPSSFHSHPCLVSDKPAVAAVPMSLKGKEVMEIEADVFVQTYVRAPLVLERGQGCGSMTTEVAANLLGHGDPDRLEPIVVAGIGTLGVGPGGLPHGTVMGSEGLLGRHGEDDVLDSGFRGGGGEARAVVVHGDVVDDVPVADFDLL